MSVVLIPQLNANEDELLLASLLVDNGDEVDVGDELAILIQIQKLLVMDQQMDF